MREGFRKFSVARFLIALVLFFLLVPFLDQLGYGRLIESVAMTLVLLSAVLAVGGRRRSLLAAAVLVTPPVVAKWINHIQHNLVPESFILVTAILFVAFVIVHLLRYILRAPFVDSEVLCAGIAIYLLIGLLWAFIFTLVAQLDPHAFVFNVASDPNRAMAGFEALYFSFTSLTGVSFGSITPISNVARQLVMMEATVSVIYMAVLIARLVSLYSSRTPTPPG